MEIRPKTHEELIEENARLTVQVEHWKQQYEVMKEVCEHLREYSEEQHKQILELSAWKIDHSGNYRNAGRHRRFKTFDQGYSVYIMHDKEGVSYRRIADLLDMSYSSARRLYKEYVEFEKKYGKK